MGTFLFEAEVFDNVCVCLTPQQGWPYGLVCWSGQQLSPERAWRIRHILEVRQARKKHLASLRQLGRQEPAPRRSEAETLASRRHLGEFCSKNSSHLLSAFFCTSVCVCVCVCENSGVTVYTQVRWNVLMRGNICPDSWLEQGPYLELGNLQLWNTCVSTQHRPSGKICQWLFSSSWGWIEIQSE